MKWINAEQQVIVTIYDEEHEEHLVKMMSVEEMLDTYTNDGCPTIYSNPEQKKGEWEEIEVIADAYDISGVKTWASKMMCDQCGFTTIAIEGHFSQYNFCPNCGADMRKEVE